jgi:putative nucleotidyltransferase with HDIG domain
MDSEEEFAATIVHCPFSIIHCLSMPSESEQLPAKRVELILQQLDQLPTLPAVAVRVLEIMGSPDAEVDELAKLIAADPSLTTRILQLVHRADTGVRGEITSIDRAVVLLGFEAVRSAVLAIGVFETFSGPSAGTVFSRDAFWKHSVATACAAELLAETLNQSAGGKAIDTSEAFVCGLLHDIGKIALDTVLPKSFSRVVEAADLLRGNIADLERSLIGLDHMVVGKRLAERWRLPIHIRECIWLHGQTPSALPPATRNPRLVNLVSLADLLVREQHLGYSGNYSFSAGKTMLSEAVGLSADGVERAMRSLVDRIEVRAATLRLGKATSSELYREALVQANKELGRVSGQLAAKNRRLAVRARFFDALSGFQAELRPDGPPLAVLQAIGQTAAGVLDAQVVAAFSLMPGQAFAEVIMCDAAGDLLECTLVDCPTRPPVRGPQASSDGVEGPVRVAGDEMDWLLAAVSPRLTHDRRHWICMEADGICVGGVLWGASASEPQRLAAQVQELTAIAGGWSLALRTAQIRDEARTLSEQLAEANRQLQSAQSEIVRSKMMGMVGEMAAGAAHEMNNPLAVISGRSQILATQLSDARHRAAAKQIFDQSQRLSDIITEMMDFARPVPPRPAECNVAELIEQAVRLAKEHGKSTDRTIEVIVANVPAAFVDCQQISAALAEVIDNALRATETGDGRVTVAADPDPYSMRVVVTVTDTGSGMDDATLKRAFDPFFSSKPAGRRRGMGLPKALRWVECNGGSIRLESQVGVGTRAVLVLPAATAAATGQPMLVQKS